MSGARNIQLELARRLVETSGYEGAVKCARQAHWDGILRELGQMLRVDDRAKRLVGERGFEPPAPTSRT